MSVNGWMTNNPKAAAALRAADRAYQAALHEARMATTMQRKIDALRVAKANRDAAYKKAMEEA